MSDVASDWLKDHGDILFSYALRRVRDRASAEDLVQETLVAALTAPERFEGRSTIRTWLFGILRHKILDHWRRRGRETASLDEALERHVDGMFSRNGHWRADRAPGGWNASMSAREEFARGLRECLDKLSPRAAETFLLRERHGVSVERLSQDLGTSTTNVWQILSRARAALRECLAGSTAEGADR